MDVLPQDITHAYQVLGMRGMRKTQVIDLIERQSKYEYFSARCIVKAAEVRMREIEATEIKPEPEPEPVLPKKLRLMKLPSKETP